jgi:hypothetical protein
MLEVSKEIFNLNEKNMISNIKKRNGKVKWSKML